MLKLYKNLKKYSWQILLVIILTFIQVLSSLYLPNITASIIDNGVILQNVAYIWQHGILMLVVAFAGMICTITVSYLAGKISMSFGRDIRAKLFKKVENFSLEELSHISTASLLTRTTNDVQQVQMVTEMLLRMTLSTPIMAIGGLFMAIQKQRNLSIIFAVNIPLLMVIVSIVGIVALPKFQSVQEKVDKLNLILREKLSGVRVIRAYDRDEYEEKKFAFASKDLMQENLSVGYLMAAVMPFVMIIMNVTSVAIIWFGSIYVDLGTMNLGDIIAFMQYAMQIMMAFLMLAVIFIMFPRASASAARINEVLAMEDKIIDNPQPQFLAKVETLEFENVSFEYPGAEEPVLNNISFSAKAGEAIAIIGSTGSGKSTLLHLIPRFYDVTSGSIRLNGMDIKTISQQNLRSKLGFVPQKNNLFTGTIAENIRFGNPNATDDEVKYAATVAQAASFIEEKTDGYESDVERGGTNFSGGQKQRLAIARAIVRKPDIYLFDDSFSALDFKTDAVLRNALQEESKSAITIIIGQRISSIKNADKIIVLADGKIDAIGKHQELLKTSKVYYEIATSQLSEEELA
jgi:ABC-type multidrug transport system, ATPase and permease components